MINKKSNYNILFFLIFFFFTYEIIALKFNFFSFTLYLFSILLIVDTKNNELYLKTLNINYESLLKSIVYNNDFLKLTKIFEKSGNINYINNVKIIALADIIQKEKEYFYINKGYNDNIRIKDVVVNEENIIGIITTVYPNLSKAKYILSSDFEIISIIKDTPYMGLVKYLNNNLVFVPFDIYSIEKIKTNPKNTPYLTLTYGYYSIPTGIPIGYIYDTNSLNIVIKKDITNTLHTLILRR